MSSVKLIDINVENHNRPSRFKTFHFEENNIEPAPVSLTFTEIVFDKMKMSIFFCSVLML
jgi:hypothetical protein